MNRTYSTVEDFVLDPSFRSWVSRTNPESSLFWETFLVQNPDKSSLIQQAKDLLSELGDLESISKELTLSDQHKEKLWNEIKRNLPEKERIHYSDLLESRSSSGREAFSKNRPSRKSRSISYYLAAACIAVLLISGVVYYTEMIRVAPPAPIEAVWLTNSTPAGVKSTFKLPDGTVVFLNAGSSIRYQEGFSGAVREIFLEGEAFFDVAKDTLRPFLVHSGDLSTKALGTSFNIRNFKNKPVKIALITGRVQVESSDQTYVQQLFPGEGISESGGTLVKSPVDVATATAWMNKTIVFESEDFLEVIDELENWFGVEITLSNPPTRLASISGKYVNESLENILNGLSYKMDFAYKIKGTEVEINFKPKK